MRYTPHRRTNEGKLRRCRVWPRAGGLHDETLSKSVNSVRIDDSLGKQVGPAFSTLSLLPSCMLENSSHARRAAKAALQQSSPGQDYSTRSAPGFKRTVTFAMKRELKKIISKTTISES